MNKKSLPLYSTTIKASQKDCRKKCHKRLYLGTVVDSCFVDNELCELIVYICIKEN
jgi:hypothetical protein